jgi:predicted nucleotidyltransferase
MEPNSLITFLRTVVSEGAVSGELTAGGGVDTYLFGSARHSSSPSDVDLAVVYDKEETSAELMLVLRKNLQSLIEDRLRLPTDVVLLSTNEATESQFLSAEEAVFLVRLSSPEPMA